MIKWNIPTATPPVRISSLRLRAARTSVSSFGKIGIHGRNLFTLGWVSSSTDADSSLYPLFHSKQFPPAGWNTSRYVNPKIDTLVEQGRRSLNQAEREKLYGEAQDLLAKGMVWIPIYTTKEIVAAKAQVKGFTVHPVEYILALWRTWVDK